MLLFIVRLSVTTDRTTETKLPGVYGDGRQAMRALKKILAGYVKYGRNDEHGYWWAIDKKGHKFRYKISGE